MTNTARARICNKKGLHARAAAKLVKLAASFADTSITITRLANPNRADTGSAGATSILSLLMLAADMGCDVEVSGEGAHSAKAIAAIIALIERRFDEEE